MTVRPPRTDPAGWPRVGFTRRILAHFRTRACQWICDGYDRRAGLITDGALAEQDRLADLLRERDTSRCAAGGRDHEK